MKGKRLLALACALLMTATLFAFSGCGKKEENPLLITAGVLVVGTEVGYPPFEYIDNGITTGLDIELAKEIGEILGLTVQFEDTDFEGILDGLATKRYDVVMSAVTITPARAKKVVFSTPYIENWQSIVVRKGNPPITSPEGLNGLKVAYQKGTTSTEFYEKLNSTGVLEAKVSEYEKVMSCFDDLKVGRVDAVLVDSVVSEGYVEKDPDVFEITWHQKNDADAEPELFGIAVRKNNADLLAEVNKALAQLEGNGRLEELRKQFLA
ncbi:MAG: ABC transporter substrate-binding protein [Oscillospiraceae bacterium]|jgi:polar amino acid transport system substrate-binding protein|nr:ABC transporter substrate-binding protein [Oscillospiraceae bacterium]